MAAAACERLEEIMALSIKDPETEQLARALAERTGEAKTCPGPTSRRPERRRKGVTDH
jgi:hypothetical protein